MIVETGTAHGGGAWFMGDLCELIGNGRVITVDIDADATPEHPRVTYVAGDSVAPETCSKVTDLIGDGESVMSCSTPGTSATTWSRSCTCTGSWCAGVTT